MVLRGACLSNRVPRHREMATSRMEVKAPTWDAASAREDVRDVQEAHGPHADLFFELRDVARRHHALDRELVVLESFVVLFAEFEEGNVRALVEVAQKLDLGPALVQGSQIDLRGASRSLDAIDATAVSLTRRDGP